MSKHVKIY